MTVKRKLKRWQANLILMGFGIVLALLQAPSLQQADVIAEFTKPGLMTFFAVTARRPITA